MYEEILKKEKEELEAALEKTFERAREHYSQSIEIVKQSIKERRKKGEKLQEALSRGSLKKYKDFIHKIGEVEKELQRVKTTSDKITKREIPQELIALIQQLGPFITEIERKNITSVLRSDMFKTYKKDNEKIVKHTKEAEKKFKKLGSLVTKTTFVSKNHQLYEYSTYELIKRLGEVSSVRPSCPEINYQKEAFGLYEHEAFEQMGQLIGQLGKTKETRKAVKNFEKIKEMALKKEMAFHANNAIQSIQRGITEYSKQYDSIDLTGLTTTLNKIKKQNSEMIKKAQNYLQKYNIEALKKEYAQKQQEIRVEQAKQNKADARESDLVLYQNYRKELEQLRTEHPEKIERIRELEELMYKLAKDNGFSNSEIKLAETKGEAEYSQDKTKEEIVRQGNVEQQTKERELNAEMQKADPAYADYLKYFASLSDKTKAIPFPQYSEMRKKSLEAIRKQEEHKQEIQSQSAEIGGINR